AARLGLTPEQIDSHLASAFGQSLASVMYRQREQYSVVLEAAPQFWSSPHALANIFFHANDQSLPTPIASFATPAIETVPLQIAHTGLFPSVTVSFNLAPGLAVGD